MKPLQQLLRLTTKTPGLRKSSWREIAFHSKCQRSGDFEC